MSASPSGLSNGQTPTPNGGPPQFRRPKPKSDPLVARKKRPIRPPRPKDEDRKLPQAGESGKKAQEPPPPPTVDFTQQPTGPYEDFPLFTTKKALLAGMRHHVARFTSKRFINPKNMDEFMQPISLHRRDPRQPAGRGIKEDEVMSDTAEDSKERERQEILKAEKAAQRAADLAQIAPTGKGQNAAAAKKSQAFKNEKTSQVHRLDKTEAQKKESDLRYEEALPWHFEDADYKNIWVGTYEAALSDTNVMLVRDGASFKMIPLEKWYKFTQKNQFKAFTIEEAEKLYSAKDKLLRWEQKEKDRKVEQDEQMQTRRNIGLSFVVKSESNTVKASGKKETVDADELDFDADDLFQDDDEMPGVEADKEPEAVESKNRIKREQLTANIFDQTNEAEIDEEAREEQREKDKLKKLGKDVQKALRKREKMTIYESDSSNPYASESEDDTSDEEKQAEIDKRKDEEAKNKAKLESKLPSGASSKGTNTPSGRPKHIDPMKKSKNLKRSGSPNVSESSGNESTRKKKKIKHSSQPTGNGSSRPGSRPMSPAPSSSAPAGSQTPRKTSMVKLTVNGSKLNDSASNRSPPHGSPMSDGEGTGGENGSISGTRLKIRVKGASPTNSRAGSPAAGKSGAFAEGGSRAGSPAASNTTGSNLGPIRPSEIAAALPPEGISIGAMMRLFQGRVGEDHPDKTTKSNFIKLVKENSSYGKDKLLRPK